MISRIFELSFASVTTFGPSPRKPIDAPSQARWHRDTLGSLSATRGRVNAPTCARVEHAVPRTLAAGYGQSRLGRWTLV